jgi:hypothetical protein
VLCDVFDPGKAETDQDALLQRRIFNWSQGLPDWQRGLMRKLCDGPAPGGRLGQRIYSNSALYPRVFPLY